MVRRGNPELRLRLEPEVMELLRQKAGEAERGRPSGVALYVRRLIYQDLELAWPGGEASEQTKPEKGTS